MLSWLDCVGLVVLFCVLFFMGFLFLCLRCLVCLVFVVYDFVFRLFVLC